jgi:hypothetical protein
MKEPPKSRRTRLMDDDQFATLDRRIKAALGPHWYLQDIGGGDLWAFSEHAGDVPIPVRVLDEIEQLQLENGTDWRGMQRPAGRA